jgi:hypothetical protein
MAFFFHFLSAGFGAESAGRTSLSAVLLLSDDLNLTDLSRCTGMDEFTKTALRALVIEGPDHSDPLRKAFPERPDTSLAFLFFREGSFGFVRVFGQR